MSEPRIALRRTRARLALGALAAASTAALFRISGDSTALAADEAPGPSYHVEVIIFRSAGAQGGAENWSAESAPAANVVGEEATSGSSQVGHFVAALPAAQFQLTDLEAKLRSSGAYVPLAHAAWAQTASAWGTRAGFSLQRLGIDVPGLAGNVSLERGQYLHLGLGLTYTPASPPAGLGAPAGTAFALSEDRRVRFYERNYYDNPAFGVIALVTPAQGERPPGR